MRTLADALRTVLYATGFILFFGWLSLRLRAYDHIFGFAFPSGVRPIGAIFMSAGAALAILCIATFVIRGRGTPALFDPPQQFVAVGPYRYVRNPMYIGGFFLLLGPWTLLALARDCAHGRRDHPGVPSSGRLLRRADAASQIWRNLSSVLLSGR